jgi:hypothetical protein
MIWILLVIIIVWLAVINMALRNLAGRFLDIKAEIAGLRSQLDDIRADVGRYSYDTNTWCKSVGQQLIEGFADLRADLRASKPHDAAILRDPEL